MRSSVILAVGSFLLAIGASAQVREPTEQEIERAKQQYRQPTDAEVEAARKKYRMPSAAELDRAAASQSPVNVDAIPQPKGRVDVESLARAYEANRQAFGASALATDQPALLVFVTLGMPEADAAAPHRPGGAAHAVLMLRGLAERLDPPDGGAGAAAHRPVCGGVPDRSRRRSIGSASVWHRRSCWSSRRLGFPTARPVPALRPTRLPRSPAT